MADLTGGVPAKHRPGMPQAHSLLARLSPLALSGAIHAIAIVTLRALLAAEPAIPIVASAPTRTVTLLPARTVFVPSPGPGGGGH